MVELTRQQQDQIAEVATHMAALAWAVQNELPTEKPLEDFLYSQGITEVEPNSWGTIYDIMHRTGLNR